MIDRIAPTVRPVKKREGYQEWKDLLFLHWEVDPNALRKVIPESLSLDLYEGKAYVGIVPFAMFHVHPWWLPSPFAFDFLETNVRTYVHKEGQDPGVYFFSLDAASFLAVQAAKIGWGLPYYHAKMALKRQEDLFHYSSIRKDKQQTHIQCGYSVGSSLTPLDPESIEFFFAERYLLFVERNKQLYKGQVYHTPYPLQEARLHECTETLLASSGLHPKTSHPQFVHYASGVDVDIYPLEPI